MSMPSGTYYVGDLCYVMHDEWNEVCDLLFAGRHDHGCNEGEFQLADGRRFAIYNTAYGDGTYASNGFGSFGVDSGSLGCILVEDIKESKENIINLGNVVEMHGEFDTSNDDGEINFGPVTIDTKGWDEEEYDDEEDE